MAEPDEGAVVLIAAPFVGEEGRPGDGSELPALRGALLPEGLPFHGLRDDIAPPSLALPDRDSSAAS